MAILILLQNVRFLRVLVYAVSKETLSSYIKTERNARMNTVNSEIIIIQLVLKRVHALNSMRLRFSSTKLSSP